MTVRTFGLLLLQSTLLVAASSMDDRMGQAASLAASGRHAEARVLYQQIAGEANSLGSYHLANASYPSAETGVPQSDRSGETRIGTF